MRANDQRSLRDCPRPSRLAVGSAFIVDAPEWFNRIGRRNPLREPQPGRKGVVTFEQLQHAVDQLSPQERLELWKTCPAPHPPESLLVVDTSLTTSGVLRYCPTCFVVFTADGRAITRRDDAMNADSKSERRTSVPS